MHSPDMTQENIAKIRELFPHCVTETHGENNEVTLRVDFDLLRQELSSVLVEGAQERYRLDWPGKRQALLTANAPIAKTLRPCREESVDFDTTKNLYIEGDNLDALKLLQESYLGKVKMIYIDPPYNTGNDFIYEDDFAEDVEAYLLRSNQKDENGNKVVANTEGNGRFHSDWLDMMYSRIKISRNLLSDDGMIAISIDVHESANLLKICTEIYGERNFVAEIANINNPKGRSDDKFIATAHEAIFIFAKDVDVLRTGGFDPEANIINRYRSIDGNGYKYRPIDLRKTGDSDRREDRPNMFYYFYYQKENGHLRVSQERTKIGNEIEITPLRRDLSEGRWRWGFETALQRISDLEAIFMPTRNIWGIFEKDYLQDRDLVRPTSAWTFKDVNSERGSEQFIDLGFTKEVFPRPKPVGTLERLLRIGSPKANTSDIVLDFFSGSSTTAQAVFKLNAEDGSNRQFIMVQLPEVCDPKSEAFKSGYKTIAEIGKERIRRSGKKILEHECNPGWNKDIGFRVLKVDSSCMEDVYYTPDQIDQKQLSLFADNIKADRRERPEDLLYQVLIDWGVELHLPIKPESIQGKKVFFVDENALAACFDSGITEAFIQELAKRKPLRAVFRDAGFASDDVRINAEQIFKQLSPHTEVKVI